jgi:hypothetical protein
MGSIEDYNDLGQRKPGFAVLALDDSPFLQPSQTKPAWFARNSVIWPIKRLASAISEEAACEHESKYPPATRHHDHGLEWSDQTGRRQLGFAPHNQGSDWGRVEKKILLNLADISYIDSSGVGELVSAFTSVRNQQGELKLLQVTREMAIQARGSSDR